MYQTMNQNPEHVIKLEQHLTGTEAHKLNNIAPHICQLYNEFTLDMSQVEKIDLAGINALMTLYRASKMQKSSVSIINPIADQARGMMQVTNMHFLLN